MPYGTPDTCTGCGLSYQKYRAPGQPKFSESVEDMYVGSDDPKRWKRRTRGVVLGKMHEHKLESWKQHLDACDQMGVVDWLLSGVPF